MPEDTLITHTFQTRGGVTVVLHNVPATLDPETNEVIGFRLEVSRNIEHLVREADRTHSAGSTVELYYKPNADFVLPLPDPVSQELRRALQESGLTGAEIAKRLGVSPPLLSRWLSPYYHQHGMDTLRRIAAALDLEVEVKLTPRKAAS